MESPYQLFDTLPPQDYEALKADIEERGILVPVEYDEEGNILDGHHRVQIATEIGLTDYPTIVRIGLTEQEKRNHVRALNILRRHLSKDDRNKIMADMRADGATLQEIADAVGVSKSTVHREVKSTFPFGKVEGKDGKERPAVYKPRKSVFATSPEQALAAAPLVNDNTPDMAAAGALVRTAERKQKQEEREQAINEQRRTSPNTAEVILADVVSYLADIEDRTVDLLFADPPYFTDLVNPWEFVERWVWQALDKVKDTGRAFIFSGTSAEEMECYLSKLRYYSRLTVDHPMVWTYKNTLGPAPAHSFKNNWQAIYHVYGPDAPPLDSPSLLEQFNVIEISAPDGRLGNRYHKWQKPDALAERLIRLASKSGDTVLDLFCGSGTFCLQAALMGRLARGVDNDEAAVRLCLERGADYPCG